MECKFCQHLLEEGNSVCPNCGKDNAEEILTEEVPAAEAAPAEETAPAAEEVPTVVDPAVQEAQPAMEETKPAEIKEGIRMTPGKLALTIVAAVVLVAILVALVLHGMGASLSFGDSEEGTEAAAEAPAETAAPATIPADGNPDDVTCKGSYSVSDEEIAQQKDTVVATAGDDELTNADLQIYYWMQVQQFLSEYSYYAAYLGLDYTQPLDTQICTLAETSMTWQQYFLDSAVKTWHNYQCLSNASLEKGYEIDPAIRTQLDSMVETLESDAVASGFESAEAMLAYNVGVGSSLEHYMGYLELYYQGYAYFEDLYNQFQPTTEELEAYFAEHEEGYAESGITKDISDFVDVRHILIMPEGGTTDESGTTTYSEEEWEAARVKAQEILDQWKAGEATEDTFAQMANENSADSDGTDGGLYTQVTEGYMVQEFNDWIFDETRVYGDTDLVKTQFGYHVMFFVGRMPQWQYYAESDFIGEKVTATVQALAEQYPLKVDYSAIALAVVDMS